MDVVFPYLMFNGNCREAMLHYQACLGGELELQSIGEQPEGADMSFQMRRCILHASLRIGRSVIYGTDMIDDVGLIRGNSVAIVIACRDEEEWTRFTKGLDRDYNKSSGNMKSDENFNCVTDKFGNQWIIHFNKSI